MLSNILLAAAVLSVVVRGVPLPAGENQAVPVPQFVLDYAPLVWLHSQEKYMPSDISAQLANTQPQHDFKAVPGPSPLTLDNLNQLNSADTAWLTSKVDITTNPAWLNGVKPDATGKTNDAVTAAIIVNDHGGGNVDAFYMYFYAYNYGGEVFGENLGNHVGDWEHNMIRFKNGVPDLVWYSQHANGQAFQYKVLEKKGLRPIAYSSKGSHANYAKSGVHDHTIPNLNLPFKFIVTDDTNQGTLWDPTLAAYYYSYDAAGSSFTPFDSSYPTNWLSYTGRWGDQQYADNDKRQKSIFKLAYKYTGGPTGPANKQLNRTDVCPSNGKKCIHLGMLIARE